MAITTAMMIGAGMAAASTVATTAISTGTSMLIDDVLGGGGGGGGGGSAAPVILGNQAQTGLFTDPTSTVSTTPGSMEVAGTADVGSNPWDLKATAVDWMTPREVV